MLNRHDISIPKLCYQEIIAAFILLAVTVLLQPTIAFQQEIPLDSDSVLFFYPLRALHSDETVGYWNPYLFCGFPRDANPQSQLLYPPNMIFQLVSTQTGYAMLLIGHLWLGSVLMYALLRCCGLKWMVSLFGGTVFLASTFWQCKITNLGLLEGIAWMPGILLCIVAALQYQSYRMAAAASIFLALLMLAGVPHTFVYCQILILILMTTYCYSHHNWKFFGCSYVLLNSLAIGITTGMWLPAYIYSKETQRVQIPLQDALVGSIGWIDIWKSFLGGLAQPGIQRSDPWEGTCYIGITALIFVALGWKQIAKSFRLGLLLSFLLAMILTTGGQGLLFPLFYMTVPGWSFLNLPNRALVICAIILPIFAAFGLHGFLKLKAITKRQKQSIIIATLILMLSAVTWQLINPWAFTTLRYAALTSTFMPGSLSEEAWAWFNACFWSGITGICLSLYIYKYMREWVLIICLLILIIVQSIQYSQRLFLQTADPNELFHANTFEPSNNYDRITAYSPLIDIESDVRGASVYAFGMYRLPEVYGWHEIQGYDPMYPKRYGELIRAWSGTPKNSDPTRIIRMSDISKPMLDFYGVKYLVGDPGQRLIYAGNTVLSEPQVITAKLPETDSLKKISFRWLLTNAFQVPNKMPIGTVRIHSGTQTIEEFPIRAGEHIANYITEREGQYARHKETDVYRWFPLPSLEGYTRVNQYRAVYDVESNEVIDSISIEMTARGINFVILQMNAVVNDDMGLELIQKNEIAPIYQNPETTYPVYFSDNAQSDPNMTDYQSYVNGQKQEQSPLILLHDAIDLSQLKNFSEDLDGQILSYQREQSDTIQIQTQLNKSAFMVIPENHSPYWNATIDGNPVEILRVNHTFMTVITPPGEHEISIRYVPVLFYAGCIIGCISLLITLFIILKPGSRKHEPANP